MDTLKAFYDVRRDMIKDLAPAIPEADLDTLATATRGLWKKDIEECVRQYRQTGKITFSPEHPTNTCDPLTGNWQERLLNFDSVGATLKSLGFKVRIAGGYYGAIAENPVVKVAKKCTAPVLNYAISLLGTHGASLAPCIMVHAATQRRPNGVEHAPR